MATKKVNLSGWVNPSTMDEFNKFMNDGNLHLVQINAKIIKDIAELAEIKHWVADIVDNIQKIFDQFITFGCGTLIMTVPQYKEGADICVFLKENRQLIVERIILNTVRKFQSSLMLGETLIHSFAAGGESSEGVLTFHLSTKEISPQGKIVESSAKEFVDKAFKSISYDFCGKNDTYENRQKAILLLTDILSAHFCRKTSYELYKVQCALYHEKASSKPISETNNSFSRIDQYIAINISPKYNVDNIDSRSMKLVYNLPPIAE